MSRFINEFDFLIISIKHLIANGSNLDFDNDNVSNEQEILS